MERESFAKSYETDLLCQSRWWRSTEQGTERARQSVAEETGGREVDRERVREDPLRAAALVSYNR